MYYLIRFFLCALCGWFFFFKQKTAYEMRISDWSSDVCSSDLSSPEVSVKTSASRNASRKPLRRQCEQLQLSAVSGASASTVNVTAPQWQLPSKAIGKIGRASCRERVCQYG